VIGFCLMAVSVFAETERSTGPSPAVALDMLMKGNGRYAHAKLLHPHQDSKTRHIVAKAQHPFAAVLSCADSRVPPEVVFDEGMGDLFVVRVAGNVVDDAVLGSLEYAAEHLHVPVIVVLGHTRCGAVDATIKGGEPNTHIETLAKAIRPAVEVASHEPGDLLTNSVRENVIMAVKQLAESKPLLQKMIAEGHLKIVGAIYDLDKGSIEYLK